MMNWISIIVGSIVFVFFLVQGFRILRAEIRLNRIKRRLDY
mgnify:CR=1 FL=1